MVELKQTVINPHTEERLEFPDILLTDIKTGDNVTFIDEDKGGEPCEISGKVTRTKLTVVKQRGGRFISYIYFIYVE